ncbi:hypothetical protein [Nitratireductor soli]|uniref:hypothetical protein n=1 Tax=Nitratireductor soli TaxID=1670619 RepID=UPI000B1CFFD8|nr:hypothetical protein [Nitratireductor soli]
MIVGGGRTAELGRDLQYLSLAKAYGEAAGRLRRCTAPLEAVRLPFFHLFAHAIELSLKAALSFQGKDEEYLMLMGHGLERCCRRAVDGGLRPLDNRDFLPLIDMLDQPHALQAFRYPQPLLQPLPDVDESLCILADLLSVIDAYVSGTGKAPHPGRF